MRELSLHLMDVVQNSISAQAGLIQIDVEEDTGAHALRIDIRDDGRGMTPEQLQQVQSPFYTTRTTRPVGLGVPLFKMACEMTGGEFCIRSRSGAGVAVTADFCTDHIDMIPLGNMNETILLLVTTCNEPVDFVYRRSLNGRGFTLDTRKLREVLGDDIPLGSPEVIAWIRDYLSEQEAALRN